MSETAFTDADYALLRGDEPREAFYQDCLVSHMGEERVVAGLGKLVGYADYLKRNLIEFAEMDELEAATSAAATAFGGISTFLRSGEGRGGAVTAVHLMDAIIRRVHGILPADFPRRHQDPYVAEFYTQLEDHLNRPSGGDRYDQYTW